MPCHYFNRSGIRRGIQPHRERIKAAADLDRPQSDPKIGDMVCHNDEACRNRMGVVIGYCPGDQWRRIKTRDGKHRIWAVENFTVLDQETVEHINAVALAGIP